MDELPPGFVLQGKPSAAPADDLPPGFVLQPKTKPEQPPQPSQFANFMAGLSAIASGHGGELNAVKAIKGAVTLPGDVALGAVDPMSDEGIGRAADLAMIGNPVAPARVTTQGLTGIVRPAQESLLPRGMAQKALPEPEPMTLTVNPSRPTGGAVVEAAERLEVPVPRAVTSDSRAVQAAGAGLSNIPFAGAPLMKGAERSLEGLGRAAAETAEAYAPATRAEAGKGAREALEVGWKGRTTANEDKLYGRVDELVDNTVQTPLTATQEVVANILAKRAGSRISDPGGAVTFVQDAVQDAKGLTYEGVKNLRTHIGEKLKNKNALEQQNISATEMDAIYAGLSDDLRSSVTAAGKPGALSAFNNANAYAAAVRSRREQLQPLVGATSDEGVLERLAAAASSKGRADIDLLSKARKAIGAEAWDDVAGALVSRLGRDAEGNFSPQRYLTDFGKMSPEGRAIVFNSTGKGDLARSLGDIATVSSRFKELQKYANPAGTGRQNAFSAGLGAFGAIEPVSAITTVVGAGIMARILASPATASSMAKWARAYETAAKAPSTATAAGLKIASRNLATTITSNLGTAIKAEDILKGIVDQSGGKGANNRAM